jgi:hypothetical protein
VLAVDVVEETDLHNPGLRTQCRWVSMLLGHLVTLLNQYGDALDHVRTRERRTPTSELVWSLLPPLTARVDEFVISGALDPRYERGGDAFDYSLSETTATLMILGSARAHSELVAATAIAAFRSGRHAGLGLVEQACLIDRTIEAQFGDDSSCSAVLAEIDLRTGRLRYLNAGHPPPVVLRGRMTAEQLTEATRPPLGRGRESAGEVATVAEETLRTDDWLLLHTEGVTTARDGAGEPFGHGRLAEFLRREAAAGSQAAETARRLIQTVAAHRNGAGPGSAAVVLARWTSAPAIGQ